MCQALSYRPFSIDGVSLTLSKKEKNGWMGRKDTVRVPRRTLMKGLLIR